jgi:hypothetical protein
LPISTQEVTVNRRPTDDLPSEVKGSSVRWTEGLGYQIQVPLEDPSQHKVYDIEFINDTWYVLKPTKEGFITAVKGKLEPNQWGTGVWLENHPLNPKNIVISTAESFGAYLEEGLQQMSGNPGTSAPPIAVKGKKKETPEEEVSNNNGGSFRGKAPEVFDGDRTKSKAFISDMTIYMKVNRHHPDIRNPFTRIFIALSFIKGPSVVNWVKAQF